VQEISLDWQTVQSENEELKAELAQYKLPHDEWQKVRRETELATAERCAAIAESTYPEWIFGEIGQLACFNDGKDVADAIRAEYGL
jgi:hypothetical protein